MTRAQPPFTNKEGLEGSQQRHTQAPPKQINNLTDQNVPAQGCLTARRTADLGSVHFCPCLSSNRRAL